MTKDKVTIGNEDLIRIIFWFCGEGNERRVFKSNTRLQKLAFLAQKELKEFDILVKDEIYTDEPFEFEANDFGPF